MPRVISSVGSLIWPPLTSSLCATRLPILTGRIEHAGSSGHRRIEANKNSHRQDLSPRPERRHGSAVGRASPSPRLSRLSMTQPSPILHHELRMTAQIFKNPKV